MGCVLEGLKGKLVELWNEERQIERWLDSQTRLHMYVHRNQVGCMLEGQRGKLAGLWSGERPIEVSPG